MHGQQNIKIIQNFFFIILLLPTKYSDTALITGDEHRPNQTDITINKTSCYQITSCTVCLSNFIPTLIYAS